MYENLAVFAVAVPAAMYAAWIFLRNRLLRPILIDALVRHVDKIDEYVTTRPDSAAGWRDVVRAYRKRTWILDNSGPHSLRCGWNHRLEQLDRTCSRLIELLQRQGRDTVAS